MAFILIAVSVSAEVKTSKNTEVQLLNHEFIDSRLYEPVRIDEKTKPKKVDLKNLKTFHVLKRKDKLSQFPCTRCHNDSMKNKNKKAHILSHWQIKISHANETVMDCKTCHASPETDLLSTPKGNPVDFNHAYQLCAKCHGKEYRDWIGGAHGKRAGGWVSPRIVLSCTQCHDSHKPKIPKRRPVISPLIPER